MYNIISKDKDKFRNLGNSQQFIMEQAREFIKPFTNYLYTKIDIRLVRTFADAFIAILIHRNVSKGLLLSELGSYIAGFENAVSGTKRLSNLFRSEKWAQSDIEKVQLEGTKNQVAAWREAGHRVLGLIDDSTIEKPESWFSEGLGAVYSSKSARLTRIKPGYYHKGSRVCVPGYEWSAMMISGLTLIPILGLMKWWAKRGKHKENRENVFYKMLKQINATFGSTLTLVLDRGFANLPTLERLFKCQQFFIIRWKSSNLLNDIGGNTKNTWRVCFKKKAMDKRVVWDKERKKTLKIEIIYAPVWHPEHIDNPLFLVVVRHKTIKGQQPMYLLTNVQIDSVGMAWEMFFSYIQRWDIEQAFRFNKSELGIQSIRLIIFENRLKMMALLTLVYQFLLQLWRNWHSAAFLIMKKWCPRSDKRLDNRRLPLYRLRLAIFALLLSVFIAFSEILRQQKARTLQQLITMGET